MFLQLFKANCRKLFICISFFAHLESQGGNVKNHFFNNKEGQVIVSIDSRYGDKSFLEFEDTYGNIDQVTRAGITIPNPAIIHDVHWKNDCVYLINSNKVSFVKNGEYWFAAAEDKDVANVANFYVSYRSEVEPILSPKGMIGKFYIDVEFNNNVIKREARISEDLALKIAYLHKYSKINKLNKQALDAWENILRYESLANNLSGIKYRIDKFPAEYIKAVNKFHSYFRNDALTFVPAYKYAAWNFSLILAFQKYGKKASPLSHYETILENFSGDTKDILLTKLVLSIDNSNATDLRVVLSKFKADCKNNAYLQYILENFRQKDIKTKGYQVVNWDNKPVDLKSITENKMYTYVDFWASWCAPCRAEMPDSDKLRKEFSSKGINFVYISIDDNPAAWRKAVDVLKLPHSRCFLILNQKTSEVKKYFQVSAIPHYALIDRQGKILKNNYLRPSDKEISEQFYSLLKTEK